MNFNENAEYPTLTTIATIFKIVGIIILILALVGLVYGLSQIGNFFNSNESMFFIIGSILGGVVLSIPFFALAELVKIFIKIELNTRSIVIQNHNYQRQIGNKEEDKKKLEQWIKENPDKNINEFFKTLSK